MRLFLVLFISVAACGDTLTSTVGSAARSDIEQLQADVATLKEQLGFTGMGTMLMAGRLAAIEKRIDVLEKSGTKTPHLIRIEDGFDFGPFAGWDRVFIVDAPINDYVGILVGLVYFYATTDCTGQAFVPYIFPDQSTMRFAIGIDGHYISLGTKAPPFLALSSRTRDSGGNGFHCNPIMQFQAYRPVMDSGVSATPIDPVQIRIEIR